VRFTVLLTVSILLSCLVHASGQPSPELVRWAEGTPNCNIRQGNDGRTYYELSSSGFEVTLGVDSQELEKIAHRATPMLAVSLTFIYKGKSALEIRQGRFSLEYLNHRQVLKMSLQPNEIVQHLQEDVDNLTDQVEHDVRKHPEQKEQRESELQARLKDYTEMMDFVSTQSLRHVVLNPAKPAISGWVFFSVKDRWIGPWRKPEKFILRLPVANLIIEIPFSLPPQVGGVELRHRPGPPQ
jgi:hypothetical protein